MAFQPRWWVIPAVLIGLPILAVPAAFILVVFFLMMTIEDVVRFVVYWTFFHKTWREKWKRYQDDLMTTG